MEATTQKANTLERERPTQRKQYRVQRSRIFALPQLSLPNASSSRVPRGILRFRDGAPDVGTEEVSRVDFSEGAHRMVCVCDPIQALPVKTIQYMDRVHRIEPEGIMLIALPSSPSATRLVPVPY